MSEHRNAPKTERSGGVGNGPKNARKPKAVPKQNAVIMGGVDAINTQSEIKIPAEITESVTESPSEIKNNSEPDSYRIENPKSEIETMEVHHHPEVEKKGFKEYLLEGLMIFVAVTMGFFAESLREHIAERQHASEYATTLLSDLKADTTDLKAYIKYNSYASSNIDTLIRLLSVDQPKNIPSGKLYWFGLWGGSHRLFIPHDATLLELKSSGSLRYFSNQSVGNKVAQYDQLCQNLKTVEVNEQGIYIEGRKARAQLFDFRYNDIANYIALAYVSRNYRNYAPIDSFIKTDPPLLSYDKLVFNQYVEMMRSRFLSRKVVQADTLLSHATELIGVLKKEYDMEN